jgi:hypothetical protein
MATQLQQIRWADAVEEVVLYLSISRIFSVSEEDRFLSLFHEFSMIFKLRERCHPVPKATIAVITSL